MTSVFERDADSDRHMAQHRGLVDGRRAAIYWSGLGRYVGALARGIPEVMGERSPSFVYGRGVVARRTPSPNDATVRVRKLLWEQTTFPLLARAVSAPFVHLPYYEGPAWLSRPLILTIPDLDTLVHPMRYSPKYRLYYNELLFRMASRAEAIITISERSAEDIRQYLDTAASPDVTHLGVEEEFFNPQVETGMALRRRYGVGQDEVLVVSGAGLGIRKNLRTTLEATRLLANRLHAPVTLLLSGGDRLPAEIRALDCGGLLTVRATGVLSSAELAALYAAADASITASWYEGFGFAVAESMATGCPVVASEVGSHTEVGGSGALYFDPNDPHMASELLEALVTRSDFRAGQISAGLERAENFSWSKTVSQTVSIYERFL